MKRKYECKFCHTKIEGSPKHAIICQGFPVFCTQEHLEQFVKEQKDKK